MPRPVYWNANALAVWAEKASDAELEAAIKDTRSLEYERETFRRERNWREVEREYEAETKRRAEAHEVGLMYDRWGAKA